MKKNMLILLLICSVLLSSCKYSIQEDKSEITELKPVEKVESELDCNSFTNELERENCILAEKDPNLKQCLDRTLEEQIFCIALLKKDIKMCDSLQTPRKQICKININQDISVCEEITLIEDKDNCYFDFGTNNKNLESCNKIEDLTRKKICQAVIEKKSDDCLEGSEQDRVVCIAIIAHETDQPDLCEKLSQFGQTQECYKFL